MLLMHAVHIRLLLPRELELCDGTGLIQCTEDTPCSHGSLATARADESGSELYRKGHHPTFPSMQMAPSH